LHFPTSTTTLSPIGVFKVNIVSPKFEVFVLKFWGWKVCGYVI